MNEAATGYHRRKDPAAVRAALLAAAESLAAANGVQSLTIQAVAAAAGVTKGGLLHHFPGKDALIRALQDLSFSAFEAEIDRLMAADPQPHGRFTRAYIRACLAPAPAPAPGASAALITALWAEPDLRRDWHGWMTRQEARHAATDGGTALKLLRFAADGVWLAMNDGQDVQTLLPALLNATEAA